VVGAIEPWPRCQFTAQGDFTTLAIAFVDPCWIMLVHRDVGAADIPLERDWRLSRYRFFPFEMMANWRLKSGIV